MSKRVREAERDVGAAFPGRNHRTALLAVHCPDLLQLQKIRDDRQLWSSVESYFKRFPGVDFIPGICPDYARQLYPKYCGKDKFRKSY